MNAKDYNRINKLQLKDGNQLIDKIKDDFQNIEIECIVDIGCGSGNVTLLLNQGLKVKRIVGVDIDPQMIEFAEQNNSGNNNNIQYLTQDLSLDWNELRTELKQFEGKVSIIFSNYCLHWIFTIKENVVKNMFRLLAKNGRIYTNITCIPNPSDRVSNSFVSYILGKYFAIPSKENQQKEWSDSFKSVGFQIIDYKYVDSFIAIEINEFDEYWAPFFGINIFRQFYGQTIPNIFSSFSKLFGLKASSHLEQFKDENTGQAMCKLDCQTFVYILLKK